MAEHAEESKGESLIEKIEEKFHHDSSSSSDSDNEKPKKSEAASSSSIKDKIWRLFGREKPVHKVLGGGKRTDPIKTLTVNLFIFEIYLLTCRIGSDRARID